MKRYDNLRNRRANPKRATYLSETYETLQENEEIRYLLGSMEPLDAEYTRDSLVEAERVYKHFADFSTVRLQGSIKTNTHIRYHSDIDILTITPAFESWEHSKPSTAGAYYGDPVETLKAQRKRCRDTVTAQFPAVKIEDKDRALRLTGGSLKRQMDVVSANWYNTASYMQSNQERDRGVQVLDVSNNSRVTNLPFLHEYRLNQKIAATNDGAGRAIRLLKNLKADADLPIAISSYDISALAWNMEDYLLPGSIGTSLQLAHNIERFLFRITLYDGATLNTLMVPNGTRKIVDSKEGTNLAAVNAIWHELYKLLESIKAAGKALERSYLIENRQLRAV